MRGGARPPWTPFGGWTGPFDGSASNRAAPGAWPTDENDQSNGISNSNAHRVSAAKYKAADDLEAKVTVKQTELSQMQLTVALEEEMKALEQAEGSSRGGVAEARNAAPSKAAIEASALEREIEALQRSVEQLRIAADADFARELAEEDGQYH